LEYYTEFYFEVPEDRSNSIISVTELGSDCSESDLNRSAS